MTQQLRTLSALAEDLSSAPGIHIGQFLLPITIAVGDQSLSSHTPTPTHIDTHTYIYIKIFKNSKILFNSLWVTYIFSIILECLLVFGSILVMQQWLASVTQRDANASLCVMIIFMKPAEHRGHWGVPAHLSSILYIYLEFGTFISTHVQALLILLATRQALVNSKYVFFFFTSSDAFFSTYL